MDQQRQENKQLGATTNSVAWQDLCASGFSTGVHFQSTIITYLSKILHVTQGRRTSPEIHILQKLEGVLYRGEMLMVLGKPGSGCTTFLKVMAGQTKGLVVEQSSKINYEGIPPETMHSRLRGHCVYQAESDTHFPHLTVSQTLTVAEKAGTRYVKSKVTTANLVEALGLSAVLTVKVGNDLVQGCSGGERKRTSIAEVLLSDSILQCWDNPTRGLDSENASTFVKTLRKTTSATGCIAMVTLYQASENIIDVFDKVLLLYEGRQIFFGTTYAAKLYFHNLGFARPLRVSTSDYLSSLTNPPERIVREGYESRVPRTPDDFARIWQLSRERSQLLNTIQRYQEEHPRNDILEAQNYIYGSLRSLMQRRLSYRITYSDQIRLCLSRTFQRMRNDLAPPISSIAGNIILSVILGSMFYNLPDNTSSFFPRGALIFFATLTNAFLGAFESFQLWEQRPIVEKHKQYAFYRPSSEALASMIADLPNKLILMVGFNMPIYFLSNLRRTPDAFLTFFLFGFASLLTGSTLFRLIGAVSTNTASSIAPGATFILLLVIFTGFVLPIPTMPVWLGWFRYLNPIGYAFESLMINEFDGRVFPCLTLISSVGNSLQNNTGQTLCTVVGWTSHNSSIDGTSYLEEVYQYTPDHLWRNLGLIFAIMAMLCILYLLATEYIMAKQLKGEVLVFLKEDKAPLPNQMDIESKGIPEQTTKTDSRSTQPPLTLVGLQSYGTFMWNDLNCKTSNSHGSKEILSNSSGWIVPGSLTALMGPSGAGKTTLLNILADRPSVGIITGHTLVESAYRNDGFGRKIGYAQQQDLHLPSMTVREALQFSAYLRQPPKYSIAEKLDYVDEVIETLGMSSFESAIIGVVGEGLNIEQRKRVTIGIELAARPELLLFLDEPTSGLDSNTAWAICQLLRKLANNGQAILCTIHQPSATLFQTFDRLLLLHEGRTIYFGDIGKDSETVIDYFERGGARPCRDSENPAEWLLNHVYDKESSWSKKWLASEEHNMMTRYLDELKIRLELGPDPSSVTDQKIINEFAASFTSQLFAVTRRNLIHDWRTPSYLTSKLLLTTGSGLVNGFAFFHSPKSLQGIQNQIFSVFLVFLLHSNMVQIIMPHFLANRALYEARERFSKTYSWKVFILSNFFSEIPWQTVLAVIQFVTWYYPIGMFLNTNQDDEMNERSLLMFLTIWSFLLFSSTFSHMLGSIAPDPATGINISALLWSLSLIFCGVLVTPQALPGFWIFMYRVSPVTYFVNVMASVGLSGVRVDCTLNELAIIDPPSGQTCQDFLAKYIQINGGRLLNPLASSQCEICPVAESDDILETLNIFYAKRWLYFGISLVFIAANVGGALVMYRVFRARKR